ncbi:MAG: hypothetical protein ACOX4K_06245 [Bacillota bacterium]|jgi:hypothetical protein
MNNEFENWCEKACSYIRFKPDRQAVKQELLWHMEDKREAMSTTERAGKGAGEEIEKAVIEAMGDAHEIGKALAKEHKPWLGWIWLASRRIFIFTIIILAAYSIGFRGRLGLDVGMNPSNYEKFYVDVSTDYGQRTLLVKPDGIAKSDGYTIKVSRAAKWHYDWVDEDGTKYFNDGLFFTIEATNPLPWAGSPNGIFYLTAVDSMGNAYTNCQERGERAIVGNLAGRGIFFYRFEMWVEGLDPSAEWIELQYDRSGRCFSLLIPLAGGEAQ